MKILIADHEGRHGEALAAQLRVQDGSLVVTLIPGSQDLLEAVQRCAPDVIIVDMARPDRDGIDSVRQLNAVRQLPVVMFVDDDDPAFMEDAIAAGVISYHVHGMTLPAIKPILSTAMAFFRRAVDVNQRLAAAEQQIAAREAIDMAKRLLMTQDGMSEPAAHKFLRRRAMDQQKRLVDVAQALLAQKDPKNG
ncbi:MAG TPA: ANTAR domain-containing protein [Acidocella sp.]|jgi:response regulator NasT|uniref:ANTAR domain-containing response regulator n=1 Tax=Acidocella sp. TaxID=50710 RepID=UPI002C32F94B|nr:ANTAR domain-containing protein [Acidocella sp.]HVE22288.1 ANTAR domain-containing protein [Acidocella sp.]